MPYGLELPSYLVCSACLVDMHVDCAGRYEPGSCACLCRVLDGDAEDE